MAEPFDEDADVRSHLAVLGPAALAELRRILEGPSTYRTEILRALTARPAAMDLATLVAMAHTDETVHYGFSGRYETSASRAAQEGWRRRFVPPPIGRQLGQGLQSATKSA